MISCTENNIFMCSVVFLQRRSHKAGAQTCLARLVRHPLMQNFNPIVVCGESGWLTDELNANGVPVIIEQFPSARSLSGRLVGNRLFARRLAKKLKSTSVDFIVHGNDYSEGLLTLALGRTLGAKTALFLRSAGMKQSDFMKYQCSSIDILMTVGIELQKKLDRWAPKKEISIVPDGLYVEELASKPLAISYPPRRFLVLGTPHVAKGWTDLIDALVGLDQRGELPEDVLFDFAGEYADGVVGRLGSRCHFLGRRLDFPELAADYDFVINPSRQETFGMAALEVVALGVPLLTSDSGVIAQVISQPDLIYPAGNTEALVGRLSHILHGFVPSVSERIAFQDAIRSKFLLDQSIKSLISAYAMSDASDNLNTSVRKSHVQ